MIFKQEFDLSSECQIPDTKSECQGTHWSGRTGMWKDKGCGQAICFVLGKHDLILISAFVLEWLGIQGWPGFAHSTHFSVQAYIFQQGRKFEQGEISRHWLQTVCNEETGDWKFLSELQMHNNFCTTEIILLRYSLQHCPSFAIWKKNVYHQGTG